MYHNFSKSKSRLVGGFCTTFGTCLSCDERHESHEPCSLDCLLYLSLMLRGEVGTSSIENASVRISKTLKVRHILVVDDVNAVFCKIILCHRPCYYTQSPFETQEYFEELEWDVFWIDFVLWVLDLTKILCGRSRGSLCSASRCAT
ncbi:MAG: hypothetical protein RL150_80 [Candidatus Parcubacteria bacterium]